MECPKCGADNAPLKKTCQNCGAVLSGWTRNNVTGEFGFRNPDGTFTKDPKVSEAMPHAKQTIAEFDCVMEATIPALPKAVEDFIDEYIEKIKAETACRYGNADIIDPAMTMYRQMMRLGAFVALTIKNE